MSRFFEELEMQSICSQMVLLCVALSLGGCAGKQYVPPTADAEDVATATFYAASNFQSSLQVMQFDKRGCYQGHTDVPRVGSSTPLRMVAGEERFFTLNAESTRDVCRVVASFRPEPAGKYQLVEVKDFPHGVLGVRTCGLRVEQLVDNGSS